MRREKREERRRWRRGNGVVRGEWEK